MGENDSMTTTRIAKAARGEARLNRSVQAHGITFRREIENVKVKWWQLLDETEAWGRVYAMRRSAIWGMRSEAEGCYCVKAEWGA